MESHAHVIHVDDLPVQDIDLGELRSKRQKLADPAGAREIGVSRWRIQPGGRSTPAHIHADEEEIFYVLAGHGVLWQDGKTCEVSQGDCIVHRTGTEAHTLLAAEDSELDVLAFAEGSRTGITYIPRTKMYFLGARWLPADAPNPFRVEADMPPLERPEPGPRFANVVNIADVEWNADDHDGYVGRWQYLSRTAGSRDVGLRHNVHEPGQASCPPHFHLAEEECFYFLRGHGEIVIGEDAVPVRPGSFAVRPPGTNVPHIIRAGDEELEYLAFGQNRTLDVVFYTQSQKVNISGVMFRVEPAGYFDGEP